jgi:hypothetical protein
MTTMTDHYNDGPVTETTMTDNDSKEPLPAKKDQREGEDLTPFLFFL